MVIGLLMLSTCEPNQTFEEPEIRSVTYSAMTRGSSFMCKIDEHKIHVVSEGLESYEKSKEITKEQWSLILKDIEGLALDNLNKLDVPSHNSDTDRTRIAVLSVHSTSKDYESIKFDEGNPPKVLSSLINKMLTLAKTVD